MFGLKPIEIILLLAVGFLFYDRFIRAKGVVSNGSSQSVMLNGASRNTAPSLIKNYSDVGDNFDLQVEAMTRELGY